MRLHTTRYSMGLSLAATLALLGPSPAMAQDDSAADTDEVEVIVVTGARTEQNIEDVAGSISVMTSVDIEDQMVTDMTQLFRYEPGINVTGSNGTAQNIIVRGMGGDRVMMIKDGMRMNEGYGADGMNDVVGRGFVDMDTIKQVEVAKGANSSLYGADALGGIVAFATKDAADLLRGDDFYASISANTDGRSSETGAGILTAFKLGNFETLVSFKGRDGNETQNYTDERAHAEIKSEAILFKTDYVIDDGRKLTLSADFYNEEVDRPDDGAPKGNYVGLPGWTINLEESSDEKKSSAYRLRYRDAETGLSFIDTLDVSAYVNTTEQTNDFILNHDTPAPFGPGGSRDQIKTDLFEQDTTGVSLSAAKLLGDSGRSHLLSFGFDWDASETIRPRREQRIQSDGTVTLDTLMAPFPKNETERLGIYLQDTIELGENFTLIPGLRYDRYSMDPKDDEGYSNSLGDSDVAPEKISDSNISGRVGLNYSINDNFDVYVQYAQGFKVPPYDLAYFYFDHVAFSGNGIRIVPAADLVPEESDSWEIGMRVTEGDFSYSLSAYQSDYDNFIQIGYVETVSEINMDFGFPFPIDVDVFQYQNIDAATISGLEFHMDYVFNDNFSAFLNGEWMDSEDKSSSEQLSTIQPLNGTLGINYSAGRTSIDTMLRWVRGMTKNPSGTLTIAGYSTIDVFARHDFNDKLSIGAGLLNLLDKEYIEYSRIAGIPDDGRDLTLYSEPGRTFSATLRYEF